MSMPLASAAVLGALLAVAVAWDLRLRKIPNALVVVTAAGGLLSQLLAGGPSAAGSGLAALGICLALSLIPYSKGLLGGGDLKLAAAVALWFGLSGLAPFLLGAALGGGFVAAWAYQRSAAGARAEIKANLVRLRLAGALPTVEATASGRVSVPYALAIAGGAAAALAFTS